MTAGTPCRSYFLRTIFPTPEFLSACVFTLVEREFMFEYPMDIRNLF